MAEAVVFGISRMPAGLLDGLDHFARLCDGNDRILPSVKHPKRHSGDPDGHRWIAASAQRNGGGKNVGPLCNYIPGSVAAVGLPCNVDPSVVDAQARFD